MNSSAPAAEADYRALRKLMQRLRTETESAVHLAEILRGFERVASLRDRLDGRSAGPALNRIGQSIIDALIEHLMQAVERKKQHRACLHHVFQRLADPQTRLHCVGDDAAQDALLVRAETQGAELAAGAAADLSLARIRHHHTAHDLMRTADMPVRLQEVYGLLDALCPIVEDLSRLMGIATEDLGAVRQAAAEQADRFWQGYAG